MQLRERGSEELEVVDGPGPNTLPIEAEEELTDAVEGAGVNRADEADGAGTVTHPMEVETLETAAQEGSVVAEQGSPRPYDLSEDEVSADGDLMNQAQGEEKETPLAGTSQKGQGLSDAVLPGASRNRKNSIKSQKGR